MSFELSNADACNIDLRILKICSMLALRLSRLASSPRPFLQIQAQQRLDLQVPLPCDIRNPQSAVHERRSCRVFTPHKSGKIVNQYAVIGDQKR